MNKSLLAIFATLLISQNPVSDQGEDQIVEPGQLVTISGQNSYALDGNSIQSFLWTVPQDILDSNPDLNLTSQNLTFTAPNATSSIIYSISLQVTDNLGNTSLEYDSQDLLITEYCEVGTGNPSANKFIEIFNGTGQTITEDEWVDYEVWISKNGADFMNPDQDFYAKLFFHRLPSESDADHDIDLDDITTIYPPDLQNGQSLVLVKELAGADADIIEHECFEWGDLTRLGGDDGAALVKKNSQGFAYPIDTVGYGSDPGSGWDVAGESAGTKDNILVRKSSVVNGNFSEVEGSSWENSAGTNSSDSDWIVKDDEDFSTVGSHTCTACDNAVQIIVAIPPVANAGQDLVTCSETVTLNGAGPSGNQNLTYSWSAPGAVPLSSTSVASPSFSSPTNLSQDTVYCFDLIVNDGYVDSDPDQVCITVQANLCPVSNAGDDKSFRLNQQEEIVLSASGSYDPNAGDVLSYTWEPIGDSSDLLLNGQGLENLTISGLPTELAANPTEFSFKLTVEDQGLQPSLPDTVTISLADFSYPQSPNLYAVPYSDYIKLSWDFISESSIDPLTRYADFEGYKLYRSEDGGDTWCSSEFKIYDFEGNDVGCQPIAQFDLTENQDLLHCVYKPGYADCERTRNENINEYDSVNGWTYLGDNSGLEHIYIDEDVVEGKQYTYTLTAYDMGLKTYSFDYVFSSSSTSSGEPYQDVGTDGCADVFEDGLGGCLSSENSGSSDPNQDNYDSNSGTGSEGNLQYDLGEPFTDSNDNTVWDGDPIYTQETNWSQSNPDEWTSIGQNDSSNSVVNSNPNINSSFPSQESPLGSFGSNNFVQAVAGALPTNISEPSTDNSDNFILAGSGNIGNGNRYFDIVDRSDLEDVIIKFEVQAEYGLNENGNVINSFEANKCENPSLYGWVVDQQGNPVESSQILISSLSSSTSLNAELDLPGVNQEGDYLVYPSYIVEDMPIAFSDELGSDENWTELLYGTRFKFDNNFFFFESTKDGALYVPPLRDAYTIEASEDSSLMTSLFISDQRKTQITYYSQQIFDMRPPYRYKIEFSNVPEFSVSDMVVPAQPWSGSESCSDEQGATKVPFRVTNLTTNQPVNLIHRDFGLNDGYVTDEEGNTAPDYGADGRKDCFWTRSELILFNELITTYYTPSLHAMSSNYPDEDNYTYELDLDYFMFREFGTSDWDSNIQYSEGDQVLHQSMIWEATDVIPNYIPPPSGSDSEGRKGWFDCGEDLKCNQDEEGFDASSNPDPEGDDYNLISNPDGKEGDGFNDNPWSPRYPWKAPRCSDSQYLDEQTCTDAGHAWEYDTFFFTPFAWYADGDSWTVDLSEIGDSNSINSSTLSEITVVPNPYRAGSIYNQDYDDETIYFKNLPSSCKIKIYTVTGKLVNTINFNSSENNGSGQFPWHLDNSNGDKVAPGLYIYYVEAESYNHVGKFAIVR